MKCPKCNDRGFTEENYGITVILCDCDKAKEVAEANGIPWREYDSSSTINRDNQLVGSGVASEPQKSSKQKANRKVAKKPS